MDGKVLMRLSTKYLSKFLTILVVVLLLALHACASAEEITYTGNKEDLLDGQNDGDIYGGFSKEGAATNNAVTVDGSFVAGGVSGGSVAQKVFGGQSVKNGVTGNIATVSGGLIGDDILGGWSESGEATGNTTDISSVSVAGSVVGGWSHGGSAKMRKADKICPHT